MDQRRLDVDWLRIIAFALLILYHVGMFYSSWEYQGKSSRGTAAIEPLMFLANPWRMPLLFLVSGVATRFVIDKMSLAAFTAIRLERLVPPLLFAVFLVVPPQVWNQLLEALDAQGLPHSPPLDHFYWKYVTGTGGWCQIGRCMDTPGYGHLWFVAYLAIYTLILIPLWPLLRRTPTVLGKLLSGPLLIVLPWAFLYAARMTLFPHFDETRVYLNDWYLHVVYFGMFLLGVGAAKYQPFFDGCMRWRWLALPLAVACWAIVIWSFTHVANPWHDPLIRGVREMQAWCAIVAAVGFAHRHLQGADGPVRRMLTEAIFPAYLIHQTILVLLGHVLDDQRWPLLVEAPLLIAGTAMGCWIFYELGRRVPWLRMWIGLRRLPPERGAKPAA